MANLVLLQQQLCIKYGMTDNRLSEAINDISASFCNRTFQTMMPLVIEVLDNMTKKYEKEKDTICVSYGRVSF